MDTIETFDFNELKICSDELKEINRGKPCGSYKASTVEKYREFKFEYKGDKPTFKVDGNLSFLVFPYTYPGDDGDEISLFRDKLRKELISIMKPILDEYEDTLTPYMNDGIPVHAFVLQCKRD